ncbi:hypothetical protein NBRC10513_005029 [Rhodotorula toruloides]
MDGETMVAEELEEFMATVGSHAGEDAISLESIQLALACIHFPQFVIILDCFSHLLTSQAFPNLHSTLLTRLWLNCNNLGSFKLRMGLGTGLCECGKAVETRQHCIHKCSLYTDERQQLWCEIGASNLKMDTSFPPHFFQPLLCFILASYHFPQLYAPLPLVAPAASGSSPL